MAFSFFCVDTGLNGAREKPLFQPNLDRVKPGASPSPRPLTLDRFDAAVAYVTGPAVYSYRKYQCDPVVCMYFPRTHSG